MLTREVLRSYEYFRQHDMPAAFAHRLALAESMRHAEEGEGRLRVVWEWDHEGAAEWYCQCGCRPSEVLALVVQTRPEDDDDLPWETLDRLCGIGDPDDFYQRYLEAELCLGLVDRV